MFKMMKVLCLIGLVACLSSVNGATKNAPIVLDETNWDDMLQGEWMVKFYAPWCPACKALQPIWKDFASWSDDLGINIAQVDVTDSPGLSGRFMVTALPTVYHVKEGVFRQYRGPRDKDSLMSFVEEKKWVEAEEVPAWKSPGSYQMAVVSQFFKLSMSLRSVHTMLVQEYGLPEWGSYIVFALCTIVTGALIGLVLVCVIDLVFPPQPPAAARVRAESVTDGEEDLTEEHTQDEADEESQVEEDDETAEASQEEEAAETSQQEEDFAETSQQEKAAEPSQQEEAQASQEDENATSSQEEKEASSQEEVLPSSQGEDAANQSQEEGPAQGARRRRTRRAD